MLGRTPLTRPGWLTPVALVLAIAAAGLLGAGCSRAPRKPATAISAEDRAVLASYESVRAALADDDLRKTRLAGEKLAKAIEAPGVSAGVATTKVKAAAKLLGESFRIDQSRAAFKEISAALIPLCDGVEGFYVISSSLVADGNWVQPNREVSNPYLGRAMATHGEIRQ